MSNGTAGGVKWNVTGLGPAIEVTLSSRTIRAQSARERAELRTFAQMVLTAVSAADKSDEASRAKT